MYTGTSDINDVGKIAQQFVYNGWVNVEVTYNYITKQWIISGKK